MQMSKSRYSDADRQTVRDFIHDLYRRSGQPTWAAFARDAQVGEFGLADWRNGRGMPDAVNLMRLMVASGALASEPPAPDEAGRDLAAPALDVAHQAQLAEAAELVREVRLLLPELRGLLAAQHGGAGAPPRGRAARG